MLACANSTYPAHLSGAVEVAKQPDNEYREKRVLAEYDAMRRATRTALGRRPERLVLDR